MNVGNQTVSCPFDFHSSLVNSMEVNRTETVWLSTFFTISLIYVQQNQNFFFNQMVFGHIDFYRIDKNTMKVNGTLKLFCYQHSSKYLLFSLKKNSVGTKRFRVPFTSIVFFLYILCVNGTQQFLFTNILHNIYFVEESKSCRFATTLGGVNDRISFFGGLYLK